MTPMERDAMVVDAVACPRCKRAPGQPCRTTYFRRIVERHPHVARVRAADLIETAPMRAIRPCGCISHEENMDRLKTPVKRHARLLRAALRNKESE